MFALKTIIEDDMLEHIRKAKTPKEAWDTFATLFSKRNDTRLQLLKNELLSVAQRDMTIAEYFHKVKSICRKISELDPNAAIVESKIKKNNYPWVETQISRFRCCCTRMADPTITY
ncbi:hypothetical protein ACFX13_021990 [Malus domestica]